MKSGAVDFIEKPFNNQAVIDAIQGVMTGVEEAVSAHHAVAESAQALESLTERERKVLDGVAAGETNTHIANRLGLSEKTIEVHRARVMCKFDAKTLAELVTKIASVKR